MTLSEPCCLLRVYTGSVSARMSGCAPTPGFGAERSITSMAAQQDERRRTCSCLMPDAADVTRLARLSRLTHLDLGFSGAVLPLAPLLPDLQSLVLPLSSKHDPASGSAVLRLIRTMHSNSECH
jgi:hypothetical protein